MRSSMLRALTLALGVTAFAAGPARAAEGTLDFAAAKAKAAAEQKFLLVDFSSPT